MDRMKNRPYLCAVLAGVVSVVSLIATAPAVAGEAVPTDLDVSQAGGFLGKWLVTIDFNGNEFKVLLNVEDIDGKVGATLDSARQAEPQVIENITRTEEGLAFEFEMRFGENGFPMTLYAKRNGDDTIVGTISDANDLFNSTFRGIRDFGATIEGDRPNPTDTRLNLSGKWLRITFSDLESSSEDYKRLMDAKDGDVFLFVGGRATKLFTDANITLGDTVVKTENVAKDYPGVYSLWLKRVGDGWHLVFNEEPDIWGTQHNPEADVAEIPLTLSTLEESQDAFLIKLEKQDETSAVLRVAWGTQEWTANLSLAQ